MLSTKLKLSWVLVIVGRSTFSLEIYPGGDETAEVGKISVFLSNEGDRPIVFEIKICLMEECEEFQIEAKVLKIKGDKYKPAFKSTFHYSYYYYV